MEISIQKNDDSAVLEVRGRLMFGEPIRDLHSSVKDLVRQGVTKVVVNLGGVSHLDSSGIEVLLAAYRTCTESGGSFRLDQIQRTPRKALRITRLESMFGLSGE